MFQRCTIISTHSTEAEKVGGKPEWVELDPSEAFGILHELRKNVDNEDVLRDFKLESTVDEEPEPMFIITGKGPITKEVGKEFIKKWIMGTYKVTFAKIPLRVKYQKKQEPEKPPETTGTGDEWKDA